MVSLQHTLCYLLSCGGDMNKFRKGIAYCLLPDGIRAYLGPRAYSHFEQNPENNDISWYKYPSDLKTLTKEKANLQDMHLAYTLKNSCLGEPSHVDKFVQKNLHLDYDYFQGVLTHLIQDYIFDDWVRSKIDCSKQYGPDEEFIFYGKTYKGEEIRNVIVNLEFYGFHYLSYLIHELYGIVPNQEWFYENVYKVLRKNYSKDLALKTYKYMKIPEKINEKITNLDWSDLNVDVINEEYRDLYDQVIMYSIDTHRFFRDYYELGDHEKVKVITRSNGSNKENVA